MGGDNPEEWQGCKGRSLMLTPYGKVAGVASDSGEATVTVGGVGDVHVHVHVHVRVHVHVQRTRDVHMRRTCRWTRSTTLTLTLTLTLTRWMRSTSSTHVTRQSSRS